MGTYVNPMASWDGLLSESVTFTCQLANIKGIVRQFSRASHRGFMAWLDRVSPDRSAQPKYSTGCPGHSCLPNDQLLLFVWMTCFSFFVWIATSELHHGTLAIPSKSNWFLNRVPRALKTRLPFPKRTQNLTMSDEPIRLNYLKCR